MKENHDTVRAGATDPMCFSIVGQSYSGGLETLSLCKFQVDLLCGGVEPSARFGWLILHVEVEPQEDSLQLSGRQLFVLNLRFRERNLRCEITVAFVPTERCLEQNKCSRPY